MSHVILVGQLLRRRLGAGARREEDRIRRALGDHRDADRAVVVRGAACRRLRLTPPWTHPYHTRLRAMARTAIRLEVRTRIGFLDELVSDLCKSRRLRSDRDVPALWLNRRAVTPRSSDRSRPRR